MAEQTFRSPGFFEREIDLSARQQAPTGTPAGIIGTSEKGPAFLPVTVGSFADFETRFGTLHPDRHGPYAAREYLKNKDAVTYLRVLGAGANESTGDISNTELYGIVKNDSRLPALQQMSQTLPTVAPLLSYVPSTTSLRQRPSDIRSSQITLQSLVLDLTQQI